MRRMAVKRSRGKGWIDDDEAEVDNLEIRLDFVIVELTDKGFLRFRRTGFFFVEEAESAEK